MEDSEDDAEDEKKENDDDTEEPESDLQMIYPIEAEDSEDEELHMEDGAVIDAMVSVLKDADDDKTKASSEGRQARKSTVPAMFSVKNPRMSVRQNSSKTIADDETEEVEGHGEKRRGASPSIPSLSLTSQPPRFAVIKKKLKKRKSLTAWWEDTPGLASPPRPRLRSSIKLGDDRTSFVSKKDASPPADTNIKWDESASRPRLRSSIKLGDDKKSLLPDGGKSDKSAPEPAPTPESPGIDYAALAAMPDTGYKYVNPDTLTPIEQQSPQEQVRRRVCVTPPTRPPFLTYLSRRRSK